MARQRPAATSRWARETKLGNSALVGLRYGFYLRKQLALEADVAVAPSHDLQGSVDVCGASGCYGRGDYARAGAGQPFDTAMNAFFGGPMGGRSAAWRACTPERAASTAATASAGAA